MSPDWKKQRNKRRPVLAAVTAATCLFSSLLAGVGAVGAEPIPAGGTQGDGSVQNRLVEFNVDAGTDTVTRAKAEQYNNANNINKNINNVEQVVNALGPDGLKTQALRNFIMINWFYNENVSSIDDPANQNNAYLQGMRKADNDFFTRYSENMLLVFKFSSADLSKRVLGPNGTNFAELEKGMKVVLEGIKRANSKVKYIEAGNEFDLDVAFQGTTRANLDNYMKMYRAFSNAVKHVNSLGLPGEPLQLGGPTLAQFSELLLAGFLDRAAAAGDQVDFISWHHYRPDSAAFQEQTATVKRLLDERNLSIPMVVSEYGFVGGGTDYNPSKELLAKNAAFMADTSYQMSLGSAGHPIKPMSWVTSHDTAYFKNEFLTGYQLSRGTAGFENYDIQQPAARQYLYIRGVGDTAPGETVAANRGKPVLGIKEIKLYDEAGAEIAIPAGAVSASNGAGNFAPTSAVTDGNDSTFWDGSDTTVAVESKVALRVDLGAAAPTVKTVSIKWHNVTASPEMPVYRFRSYGSDDQIVIYDYLGHVKATPFFHALQMQSWLGDTLLATRGGSNDATGVRMMATRNSSDKVTMMVWNTQLDGAEGFDVKINVDHLPSGFTGKNVHMKRFLTDEVHSNLQYDNDDRLDVMEDRIMQHAGSAGLDFSLSRNAVSFIELTATDEPADTIVSVNAAATVSSGDGAALTDADPATVWTAPNAAYPQVVTLNLGTETAVKGINIDWANDALYNFRYMVETSLDGTAFNKAVDHTMAAGAGVGGTEYRPTWGDAYERFTAEARYVRVTVTGIVGQDTPVAPVSIRDIKVLGEPALLKHNFAGASNPSGWTTGGNGSWAPAAGYTRANLANTQVAQATFGSVSWKDYTVEAKARLAGDMPSERAAFNPGLLVRGHGSSAHNNAYRFRVTGNNDARVYKVVNGSAGSIVKQATLPFLVQPQTWYTLKVEAIGNTFKFYVNGQFVLDYTDEAMGDYGSGKPGLIAGNVNTDFADIKVTPLLPQLSGIQVNGQPVASMANGQSVGSAVLPQGTDLSQVSIAANVQPSGGTAWISGNGQLDLSTAGNAPRMVTVLAKSADGSAAVPYSLYVRAESANTELASVKLSAGSDPVLVPGQYEYQVQLPSLTKVVTVRNAVPAGVWYGAAAEVTQQPQLVNGQGIAVVRVTAESGAVQDYTFRFTVRPEAMRGAVKYQETFNEGLIREGWTQPAVGQFRVVDEVYGDKFAQRDVNANNIIMSNSSSVSGDADISVRVKAVDPTSYPGLAARVSADNKNFYMLRIKPNESKISLGKVINDTLKEPNNLTVSVPIDVNKWYQLRMVLQDNNIKAYADDQLLFDVTDGPDVFDTAFTPWASGKAGIRVANARAAFDDLLVTGISGENALPVITLYGPAVMSIPAGSSFTDPGAAALDAEDGDLAAANTVSGQVDTTVPGTYVLRYNVTDSKGGSALEVTRTVHVLPVARSFGITGTLDRTRGLTATVVIERLSGTADHDGMEAVFFQLMNGTTPAGYTAIEKDITGTEPVTLSATFDAADPENTAYTVRVFVLDSMELDESRLPYALSDVAALN
jgi:hypothetical protein